MSVPVQIAMEPTSALTPGLMPTQLQMLPHVLAPPQQQPQVARQQAQQPVEVLLGLSETTCVTWVAIGVLAESLGDMDKACSLYELALRHAPMNLEALTRLANICRSRDQFMKAADLYEKALTVQQENGDTWGLLGHCYLMMDDLQRAYAAYQRALYYLENPNVPRLWHGIGILYDRYGSLEYAEEAFVRVLDLDPYFEKSNEIYFRLGIIYKHQAKYQSALECFKYILNNPPLPLTQPDVWFQIGSVFEQQKNWSAAREAYEKVLKVNPNHAKVLQQLGCLYSQSEPVAPQQGQSSPPFQKDLTLALKYLLQAIEADPSDAHSWYYLGRVHMLRGDYNAAYEAFQQAVNRDSRNPTFWCSIGVLYYQISQYRDALDAYTRAIRLNPYISEVWYDLGTLYETCNNQISDALDAYRQAERLGPLNPHIKARLEQLTKYQQEGNTHSPQPPPVSQQPQLPQGMVLESTQPQHPQHVPLGQGGALMGQIQHQSALHLQGMAPRQPHQLQSSPNLPNPISVQAHAVQAHVPQVSQQDASSQLPQLHQPAKSLSSQLPQGNNAPQGAGPTAPLHARHSVSATLVNSKNAPNSAYNGQKHALDVKTESENKRPNVEITNTASNAANAPPVAAAEEKTATAAPEGISTNQTVQPSSEAAVAPKPEGYVNRTKSEPDAALNANGAAEGKERAFAPSAEPSEPSTRNDEDDHDEEEKPVGVVEPPLRKVHEEEDYDEE
ncbi:TPR-like protein [Metschnikowia bicuspidata]|uniref:TPR-like protein n=1 Tax=Metschnikowia bicuspidata TaxID=27322 RepID=A0A4P9ZBS4_9ASCO|nr:TPR-like protein [Metschnikowia bicuspidata]